MIIPVILSGGAGSRLWPVSREDHPKPFMRLADGETLLEKTYRRALAVQLALEPDRQPIEMLTVTNRDYFFMSRDEQDRAGVNGHCILEPFGRNTAPAVALAAHAICRNYGESAVMLVLAADHLILNQSAFIEAVRSACQLASKGYLVTFGVKPSAPETGFGYIEQGEALDDGYRVARFVEKPDLPTAQGYLASGRYFWNSGMFCFKAGKFLSELHEHASDTANAALNCWQKMENPENGLRPGVIEIPEASFKKVPDISLDYALMERSDNVAVVPGDFGWSDIGSWGAVSELVPADRNGNRVVGESILVDATNNFIQSQDRLVAVLGANDLMIVDTRDALLVAAADRSQDVKRVVAELKRHAHDSHRLHKTVLRPWGSYTVLEESAAFKIKRIEVKPGACLSLQTHMHRSEHWVVVSGLAKVTNGDLDVLVYPNQSTYIPAGQKHRLENPGETVCVMIEVQCGEYLGEDDIVRFEDNYGRK